MVFFITIDFVIHWFNVLLQYLNKLLNGLVIYIIFSEFSNCWFACDYAMSATNCYMGCDWNMVPRRSDVQRNFIPAGKCQSKYIAVCVRYKKFSFCLVNKVECQHSSKRMKLNACNKIQVNRSNSVSIFYDHLFLWFLFLFCSIIIK